MSNIVGTQPVGLKPKGFQAFTVSSTALALTVPSGTTRAIVTVEDQPLRWRDDGTDPTSTVGFLEPATSRFELYGYSSLQNFKMIKDGATDSEVGVVYYGE